MAIISCPIKSFNVEIVITRLVYKFHNIEMAASNTLNYLECELLIRSCS